MIASGIHIAAPGLAAALGNVARLSRTLLCLAGVAALVVALRFGVYEYFHGGGQVLAHLRDALHL
jgi:hypothetical protein